MFNRNLKWWVFGIVLIVGLLVGIFYLVMDSCEIVLNDC